jgi:two-component system response regulator
MPLPLKHFPILLVEDDENDALLVSRAIRKNNLPNEVHWVKDGLEARHYLEGVEEFEDRTSHPFPEVIILDLKMPRMNGLELLAWIDEHPQYRVIPTIVMSSSRLHSDVERAYMLGANTFMVKPTDFDSLAKTIKTIHDYWAISIKPLREQPAGVVSH